MTKGGQAYMNWAPRHRVEAAPEPKPRFSLARSLDTIPREELAQLSGKDVSAWFAPRALAKRADVKEGEPTEWRLRTEFRTEPQPMRIHPPVKITEAKVQARQPSFPEKIHHT